MIKCLIHPITYAVVAELDPGKELKIYDEKLLEKLTVNGITIPREFQKSYQGIWKVYPSDEKEIFVKAFEQFSSIHLQKQGYYWRDKLEYEAALAIPTEELVKKILSAHKESMKRKKTIEDVNEEIEPERKIPSKNINPDQESSV